MQSTPRVVIPSPSRTFRKYCAQSKKIATSPNCKQITQPSGAATPRNSDAHKRIAVPQAFCVLWEHPRPSPKSGKARRSGTRPGDVRERAERSEGSDTTPIRNAPCFAVCALVCDPLSKSEGVPTFARESERGPFVREVEKQDEKRLGDKIYGSSFARFFSSAGVEGSQRTGKCMYIKAWRNKKISLEAQSRAVAGGGKRPVSACKPLCAILLRKPRVYPLSPVKANVGHL